MPKIQFSSLINSISGSMAGSTFRSGRGWTILQRRYRSRYTISEKQAAMRKYMNDLVGDWNGLTDTQRELWDKHASLSEGILTGVNSFLRMNMRLLGADYSTLTAVDTPPKTPSTPEAVVGASVVVVSSIRDDIYWSSPATYDTYIQVYFSVEPGFSFKNKEKWRLLSTLPSALGVYTNHHDYPSLIPRRYRCRTIDSAGRVSPYTAKFP